MLIFHVVLGLWWYCGPLIWGLSFAWDSAAIFIYCIHFQIMHSPLHDADAVLILSCFCLSHSKSCSWSCHSVNSSFKSLSLTAFIGLEYSKPILILSLFPFIFLHAGARFLYLCCVFKFVRLWWVMNVWLIDRWVWCLCRS